MSTQGCTEMLGNLREKKNCTSLCCASINIVPHLDGGWKQMKFEAVCLALWSTPWRGLTVSQLVPGCILDWGRRSNSQPQSSRCYRIENLPLPSVPTALLIFPLDFREQTAATDGWLMALRLCPREPLLCAATFTPSASDLNLEHDSDLRGHLCARDSGSCFHNNQLKMVHGHLNGFIRMPTHTHTYRHSLAGLSRLAPNPHVTTIKEMQSQ